MGLGGLWGGGGGKYVFLSGSAIFSYQANSTSCSTRFVLDFVSYWHYRVSDMFMAAPP